MSGKGIFGLLSLVFCALLATVLVGRSASSYLGGGLQSQANRTMQDIRDIKGKVAVDAVARYRIAQGNGSPMDVCEQARSVTAAYRQAQDEANYEQWKQTEKADCSTAGIEN
jgi:hypothetical protein